MDEVHDLLTKLTIGNYVFTAASWAWTWMLYNLSAKRIRNNDLKHLDARVELLEEKVASLTAPRGASEIHPESSSPDPS